MVALDILYQSSGHNLEPKDTMLATEGFALDVLFMYGLSLFNETLLPYRQRKG